MAVLSAKLLSNQRLLKDVCGTHGSEPSETAPFHPARSLGSAGEGISLVSK